VSAFLNFLFAHLFIDYQLFVSVKLLTFCSLSRKLPTLDKLQLRDCFWIPQLAIGNWQSSCCGIARENTVGNWQLAAVLLRDCFWIPQLAIGNWQSSCCGIASENCSWQLAVGSRRVAGLLLETAVGNWLLTVIVRSKRKVKLPGPMLYFLANDFSLSKLLPCPPKLKHLVKISAMRKA
jgi:hypothetical protein